METPENSAAQERFIAAFEKLGLPQARVCEVLDVSQKTVSNYITGKVEPPLRYVEALENYQQDESANAEPHELRQLENLLWRIGNERPQSREIIQNMLELNTRLRSLLTQKESAASMPQSADSTDVLQTLATMHLRPGTNRYDLFKWILERPEREFTVEDAKKGINGGSSVYDYLKDAQRGKVSIPGFVLIVVNEGSTPLVYKLIHST